MPYVHGHLHNGEWVRPRYRVSRRGIASWAAAAAAVPLVLGAGVALRHVGPPADPGSSAASSGTGRLAATSGPLSLYTEPSAGMAPVYGLISDARRIIRLTMCELVDQQAEQALVAAVHRHVRVQVLLDRNRERARNQAAYTYLGSHGVQVSWADPRYAATHEKALSVDRQVAAQALAEDDAGSVVAKKGSLSHGGSVSPSSDYVTPPLVTLPLRAVERVRRMMADEPALAGLSIPPLLQPPLA